MAKIATYLLLLLSASITGLKAQSIDWAFEREVDYYLSFMEGNHPSLKGEVEYLLLKDEIALQSQNFEQKLAEIGGFDEYMIAFYLDVEQPSGRVFSRFALVGMKGGECSQYIFDGKDLNFTECSKFPEIPTQISHGDFIFDLHGSSFISFSFISPNRPVARRYFFRNSLYSNTDEFREEKRLLNQTFHLSDLYGSYVVHGAFDDNIANYFIQRGHIQDGW